MPVRNQYGEISQGQDADLRFTGTDGENPTGWTLLWTLVNFKGETTAVMTKVPTVIGAVSGEYVFSVTLTRAETLLLLDPAADGPYRDYRFDAWRTDTGENIPLADGTLRILDAARLAT